MEVVMEALFDAGIQVPLIRMGIQNRFHECGSQAYIEQKYGLDQDAITKAVVSGV